MSLETPPPKHSKGDKDSKPLTWDEIVAKFTLHGITPQQLGAMTLKQAHYAMQEWGEDLKLRFKLAGFEVKEEEEVQTINAGNAEQVKQMINAAIRGR